METDRPDKKTMARDLITKILCADLDDPDTYVEVFEFLETLFQHVPEDRLHYWLHEHPEEHRRFIRAMRRRRDPNARFQWDPGSWLRNPEDRPKFKVIDGGLSDRDDS